MSMRSQKTASPHLLLNPKTPQIFTPSWYVPTVIAIKTASDGMHASMQSNTYKYKVQMTCGGCSGAVTRVLQRAQDKGEGVESFTVSLEDQSVVVHGPIEFEDLTNRIAKTGKKVCFYSLASILYSLDGCLHCQILEKEQVIEPTEMPSEHIAIAAAPVAVA